MLSFLAKRVVQLIPTLFFVSILIFSLQQLLPGDPAMVMAGEERDPAVIAQIREQCSARGGVLCRALADPEHVFLAVGIDTERERILRGGNYDFLAFPHHPPRCFYIGAGENLD